MRAVRSVVVSGVLLTLASCSEGTRCAQTDAVAIRGLSVEVRDELGAVCDANVTAVDGEYSEALMRWRPGSDVCAYEGATERAGTYTITVVSGERSKTVTGIVVSRDACHVMNQTVTVMLD